MYRCLVYVLLLVALPAPGYTQSTTSETETPAPPPGTTAVQTPGPVVAVEEAPPQDARGRRGMRAFWDDGLTIESSDGAYQLRLGAFVRFDGRFIVRGAAVGDLTDTLTMRIIRATIQGRITRHFTFRLQPDFTSTVSPIADAFIDLRLSDAAHVRLGRDKTPIGFEAQLGDANLLFMERGMPQNLTPGRDVGVQVYGNFGRDFFSYVGGVFNGTADGSVATNIDTNNGKELVGRVILHPFTFSRDGAFLEKIGVGVGMSREQQNGERPIYRLSSLQPFFAYDTGVVNDGLHTRVAPQISHYYRNISLYSDYVRSRQFVRRGEVVTPFVSRSWQAAAAIIVTGEVAGERVRPKHAFDPERHQWGALQVTARYGTVNVDDEAFTRGIAGTESSQTTRETVFGAVWFMTTNVKVLFNYEHATFDGGRRDPRDAEAAALCRLQLNF